MGQRSISPDRVRRPASAAAVLGPQQQQKQLHRLHRDNSYDQQVGQATEAQAAGGAQRAGSAGLLPQHRSPADAATLRGPPLPGMPPMPAGAWQHRPVLPEHQWQYMQMYLAQQQQQHQQQLQLPQAAMQRRPARMSSPAPYGAPTSPIGLQGGSAAAAGYLPTSANAVAAALAAQQQQQLMQQGLGMGPLPLSHSGSRQGLQGAGSRGAGVGGPAAVAAQSRSAAALAAAAAGLRTSPAAMGGRPGASSFSAGLPGRSPQLMQQQQQLMPGLAAYPLAAAYGQQQAALQQQMATLLLRQQQLRMQEAALAAAGVAGRGSFGGSSSQHDVEQQQYEGGLVSERSEDYGLWAAPPDYGAQMHADDANSSRAASGNSRSFIAPSGGQYWQGRRSNSWSNLPDAVLGADPATSPPQSELLPRSRSSGEVPHLAGVTEAAAAQEQQPVQQPEQE